MHVERSPPTPPPRLLERRPFIAANVSLGRISLRNNRNIEPPYVPGNHDRHTIPYINVYYYNTGPRGVLKNDEGKIGLAG